MEKDKEESGDGIRTTAKVGAVAGAAVYGTGGAINGAVVGALNPVTLIATAALGIVGGLVGGTVLAGLAVAVGVVAVAAGTGALIGGGVGAVGGAVGGGIVGGLLGGLVKGVKKGVEWAAGLVTGENSKSPTPAQDLQQQLIEARAMQQQTEIYLQQQKDARAVASQAAADPNAPTNNAAKVAANAAVGQGQQTARV